VWSPYSWELDDTVYVEDWPRDLVREQRRLLAGLQAEAGIAAPHEWVLEEACRRVTHDPPRPETTEDFVAFPLLEAREEYAIPVEHTMQSIARIVPEHVDAMLREKRLLVDGPLDRFLHD